jgi:hypothetical protein
MLLIPKHPPGIDSLPDQKPFRSCASEKEAMHNKKKVARGAFTKRN